MATVEQDSEVEEIPTMTKAEQVAAFVARCRAERKRIVKGGSKD